MVVVGGVPKCCCAWLLAFLSMLFRISATSGVSYSLGSNLRGADGHGGVRISSSELLQCPPTSYGRLLSAYWIWLRLGHRVTALASACMPDAPISFLNSLAGSNQGMTHPAYGIRPRSWDALTRRSVRTGAF